jgi:hypothetical protein
MESVCFNRVLGGTEPGDFLCRIGRIRITEKSSVPGRNKNSLALEIIEIIQEFLLPLMRFALSIGRTAPGIGSEVCSLGGEVRGSDGKMAHFTRREVARMELMQTAVYYG